MRKTYSTATVVELGSAVANTLGAPGGVSENGTKLP
jgi:hypothetical protein